MPYIHLLGKCPKCGADYVVGRYGPYCSGKCGFRIGKSAFGKDLTENEISALLDGKTVLLKNLISKKTGNRYDMYITPSGIREFEYISSSGESVKGYDFEYQTSFPEKKINNPDKEDPNEERKEIFSAIIEDEELPFG